MPSRGTKESDVLRIAERQGYFTVSRRWSAEPLKRLCMRLMRDGKLAPLSAQSGYKQLFWFGWPGADMPAECKRPRKS